VFLAKHVRGQGIVTRTVEAMIDWAFGGRGLRRLEWRCGPSQRGAPRGGRHLGATPQFERRADSPARRHHTANRPAAPTEKSRPIPANRRASRRSAGLPDVTAAKEINQVRMPKRALNALLANKFRWEWRRRANAGRDLNSCRKKKQIAIPIATPTMLPSQSTAETLPRGRYRCSGMSGAPR
jgi:hypothetical protein